MNKSAREKKSSQKLITSAQQAVNAYQNVNLKSPQVETILKFKNKYAKNIQNPIEVMESLESSQMPLKCFLHNNNLTLYCETDRKPLCASCMYQSNQHRGHRVIALDGSQESLKKDSEKFSKLLIGVVDNITDLTRHMNEGIAKMEKEFPQLLFRIKNEYEKLKDLIVQKEKQHLNEIKYYKEKMIYEHATLSAELNRIVLYIDQKLHHYNRPQENSHILAKRNILQVLSSSTSLISEELIFKKEITPNINFHIFRDIEDLLIGKFANFRNRQSPRKKSKLQKTPLKSLMTSTRNLQNPTQEKSSVSPASQKLKSSPSKQNLANRKKNIAIKDVKEKTPTKMQSPRRKREEKSQQKRPQRQRSKSSSNFKGSSPPKRK